jgi:hypothetical protein
MLIVCLLALFFHKLWVWLCEEYLLMYIMV